MSRSIFIAAALALAVTLPAVQAQAQAPRTFVSAAGSDSNPCSFAAPCRHFQAAVDATSAGGEVDALDPAGYGPITISRAVTIEGQGWSYAAPSANSPAVTINAVTGNVYIHGVSLNGVGIAGTTTGIQFNSGGALTVRDSVIRNFTGDGIDFLPTGINPTQLSVFNTQVSDNTNIGIDIAPTSSGSVVGVLDQVQLANTTDGSGIFAQNGGGAVNVMVRNSTIINNLDTGVFALNTGTTIRITRSTITGNGVAWQDGPGGVVLSYGDNNIDGNGSANTEPPSPLVYH